MLAINSEGCATSNIAADADSSGGTSSSSAAPIIATGVTNPAMQAVYQTECFGNALYTIPGQHAGLNYTVRLHFTEFYWTGSRGLR